MIAADSLLYSIDQKLNKLASNSHQNIPLEDKILALNEAQIKLIKQKVTGDENGGLDSFRRKYEDLQNLIVNYQYIPLVEGDKYLYQWVASLNLLNPSYLFYIDGFVIASKGDCTDVQLWINRGLTKHGDISVLINSSIYKPSFEYRETFATLSEDKIFVYTDGSFSPSQVMISYLKYPQKIDKEGYINLNGEESKNSDCELSEYLESELVDLAVMDLAGYTENVSAFQTAQYRLQTNK